MALVGLNAAMAAFLFYAYLERPNSRPSAPDQGIVESGGESGATTPKPAPLRPRSAKRSSGSAIHWDALASDDLAQYVANLRAVQCPEDTIRDIILAELNRQYGPREAALRARPEDRQPWESVAAYEKRGGESKLRQLLVEKRDLMKSLVGADVPIETPPTLAGRNLEKFEAAYKDLPESKREQVRIAQEEYWAKSDDIKQRTQGFLEPEDRAEFKRIKDERRAEMAKVLTTQELEDYEIKTSATATAMRNRLNGFNATDEEFRAMFRLTQPLDEEYSLITGTRDKEDKAAAATRREVEQKLQEQIRATLGEERYADMERARDPVYQNLNRVAEQNGLPKESVLQAYEAQKIMREEAGRLLGDPNLSPEQRQQAAVAMQVEAEKALQGILGDKGLEAFRRGGPSVIGGQVIRQVGPGGVIPGGQP